MHKHSDLLVLRGIFYIMCTVVLSVSKVAGLQDPHIKRHSVKSFLLSDALDFAEFGCCNHISCGCDLLTAHTLSGCGHQHTIPASTPGVIIILIVNFM